MRAAVFREVGAPLGIEDVTLHDPGDGMVAVKLRASGVCHSDVSFIDGTMPQATPAVLGHEGAGVVTALGPGVTALSVGDHVVLSWVAPCRACSSVWRVAPSCASAAWITPSTRRTAP